MATRILNSELEIGIQLLSGFHLDVDRLSLLGQDAAGIGIQNEASLDQIAVVLQQPVDAVERPTLFISGESKDDIAIRMEAFPLEPDQRDHQDGVVLQI